MMAIITLYKPNDYVIFENEKKELQVGVIQSFYLKNGIVYDIRVNNNKTLNKVTVREYNIIYKLTKKQIVDCKEYFE